MSNIKIGLIGGSGLGEALGAQTEGVRHEVETPFGRPSDVITETSWGDVGVCFMSRHGPGHPLNPSQVPYRANILALKKLGCTHILASGAVGSLREEYRPRDLVVVEQIIDKTNKRANTFYDKAAVHVEFAEPFCPVLRRMVLEAGVGVSGSGFGVENSPTPQTQNPKPDFKIHSHGCYVAMEGPAFSTRAESLMHRLWGGDLIGMTAMPEAKLAREAEISYALIALVTDYDCWKHKPTEPGQMPAEVDPFALLNEIIGNLKAASANAIELMKKTVELIAQRKDELAKCPAQHALQLGIWSDKARIDPEEVERLRPLWGKYF